MSARPCATFARAASCHRSISAPGSAARTIPDLKAPNADALPRFMPAECDNYFTAFGYEPE